ncbi:MAG: OPT family oligopeptide transporter [candidate division Zixibacteria bacterium]|nr:OPT family oligopeptide transporter [candidate division Zixibacteria bacterium]
MSDSQPHDPPSAAEKPLTPEEKELHWYRTVYQGDSMPQLTVRAVIMGAFLGMFMSLSNLYVGLKTGWGLGVAITACILSYSIYRTLMAVFPKFFRTEMSILENNCMQSTASSAGYSTGGTMVSGVSAYLLVTGHHMAWPILTVWIFFLAVLGVSIAIPMKRQMINVEQLKFPSGTAAAETLRSLHSKGGEAVRKARSLGLAGLGGAILAWFRDGGKPFAIPASIPFPGRIGGIPLDQWTINFDMSAVMVAAGAIIGWKTGWSMLLGAFVNYAVLAPRMLDVGALTSDHLGFRGIVAWSTWTGASIMVTSALLAFAFQWKTVHRALRGIAAIFRKDSLVGKDDPIERIEVPASWFLTGSILGGLGCIAILYWAFGTSILMGVVAVVMAFLLAIVCCRATGETDITPVGAMGKITQLLFGVLAPSNMTTNLMTASVTAGGADSSADLLTDLKSGYLLGANPRKQFIAQFLGIFAGVLVVIPAFYLLIPDAASLGTDRWPAPAAQVWAAVARLLGGGFMALHPTARLGLLIGGLIGIILPLLERAFPKAKSFIPSPMGLGLAMVIPFYNSLSMFIGAGIATILEKKKPVMAEIYIIPVASGLIAGESIMGIAVALLSAGGILG